MDRLRNGYDLFLFEKDFDLVEKALHFYNNSRMNSYKRAVKKREEDDWVPGVRERRPLKVPVQINLQEYIVNERLVRKGKIEEKKKLYMGKIEEEESEEEEESMEILQKS